MKKRKIAKKQTNEVWAVSKSPRGKRKLLPDPYSLRGTIVRDGVIWGSTYAIPKES